MRLQVLAMRSRCMLRTWKGKAIMKKIIVIIIIASPILFMTALFFVVISYGSGQHTGYITAVDQEGLLFKNYDVWIKTELSSSQEDQYCISRFDSELADKIKEASEKRQRVTIKYTNYVTMRPDYCQAEYINSFELAED